MQKSGIHLYRQKGDEDKKEPSDTVQKEPEKVPSVVLEFKGRSRRPGGEGAGVSTVFKTREELAGEGYYLTDRAFDPASSVIGQINFSYSLPSEFSYRNSIVRKEGLTVLKVVFKLDRGKKEEIKAGKLKMYDTAEEMFEALGI